MDLTRSNFLQCVFIPSQHDKINVGLAPNRNYKSSLHKILIEITIYNAIASTDLNDSAKVDFNLLSAKHLEDVSRVFQLK